MSAAWEQLIAAHYARVWPAAGEPSSFPEAAALSLPERFTVLAHCPSNAREFWTYATCGMSQPGDVSPVELHMFAPYQAPELVELLHAVAHYHRNGPGLAAGDVVNFGRPWIAGSTCTFGLLSLPYLDGPKFAVGDIAGAAVRFCWLLPITPQEAALRKEKGLDALEAAFSARPFRFASVHRASMV
jgi:hypothetical protein